MGRLLKYGLRQAFSNFTSKIILLVFAVLTVTCFSFIYLSYRAHVDSSTEREFVRLECATKPLAMHLDGRLHEKIVATYNDSTELVMDLEGSGFNSLMEQLKQTKLDLGLETDLYTLTRDPISNQLLFVVTSSDAIYYKHVWEQPHQENFSKYEVGAKIGPYTDENGTWLSVFHPIKVDGRTVAIIQADKRFDVFMAEARASFRNTLLAFLGIFLLTLLVLIQWINKILSEEERLRNNLVRHAELIEEKNSSIMASIRVADRIQQTVLPNLDTIKKDLPGFGVMYEPKDVVSGDFYWYEKVENKLYIAAGDCTGHGIPGAMMSMMASSAMYFVLKRHEGSLSKMLMGLDSIARRNWHDRNDTYAGMDVALCSYDLASSQLKFASAMRPMVILRDGKVRIVEGDRAGIGSPWRVDEFKEQTVDVREGDVVFIFSDGYVDQFGGDREKRYQSSRFYDFLAQIQEHTIEEQIYLLRYEFHLWRQDEDQIDDVLVLGFKIPGQEQQRKAA